MSTKVSAEMSCELLSEKINEPHDFLDMLHYYFQKGLIELQTMHNEGNIHGNIRPDYIVCSDDKCILIEGKDEEERFSPLDAFVPPEIALGNAIREGVDIDDAIHSYQTKSTALQLISTYLPTIAVQYTAVELKSLVGRPILQTQSDYWAYGMSFLFALDCMKEYNKFYSSDFWKNDKNEFFECLQSLLCLKTRKMSMIKKQTWNILESSYDEECTEYSSKTYGTETSLTSSTYETSVSSSACELSKPHPTEVRDRKKLIVPIRRVEHNKTRKAPRN
jgi:hypothetical protein